MKFRVFTHIDGERTPRTRHEVFDTYTQALDCAPPGVGQTQTLEVYCECRSLDILLARVHDADDDGWHISGTDVYTDVICGVMWE